MTLITRDPWQLLDQIQREMGPVFPRLRDDETQVEGGTWVPAVDIKEEDDKYLLFADVPGVAPNDIEVTMDKGVLTIRGERKHEHTTAEKGYHRTERQHGVFIRRFTLPETVDAEHISATSQDGVLQVVIPKAAPATPRKIKVATTEEG